MLNLTDLQMHARRGLWLTWWLQLRASYQLLHATVETCADNPNCLVVWGSSSWCGVNKRLQSDNSLSAQLWESSRTLRDTHLDFLPLDSEAWWQPDWLTDCFCDGTIRKLETRQQDKLTVTLTPMCSVDYSWALVLCVCKQLPVCCCIVFAQPHDSL